MYVQDPTKTVRPQDKSGSQGLCALLSLGMGRVWGFTQEEGNSQGDKKGRCVEMRCLLCHIDRLFREKIIFRNSSFSSLASLPKFF